MQTIVQTSITLASALASAVLVCCALGCLAVAAHLGRCAVLDRWFSGLFRLYKVEAGLTVLFIGTLVLTTGLCILGALWASGLLMM